MPMFAAEFHGKDAFVFRDKFLMDNGSYLPLGLFEEEHAQAIIEKAHTLCGHFGVK